MFVISTAIAALLLSGVRAALPNSSCERRLQLSIDVTPDPDQSYVLIDSLKSYKIKEGTNISIPVFMYRGKTLKRTVYIWIEDVEGERISSKAKFSLPERFISYNRTANLRFRDCYPEDTYNIVAEGIDADTIEQTRLLFEDCEPQGAEKEGSFSDEGSGQEISFEVIDPEDEVTSGIPFNTRIVMRNPSDKDLEVVAWSYVYRSSKCYSGDREQNLKTINFPSQSNVTFDLTNTAIAEQGEYSLKVKLLRSDRKTAKEFTFPLRIQENKDDYYKNINTSSLSTTPVASKPDPRTTKRQLTRSNISGNRSGVVFRSSSAKARHLTVYFLIAVLVLVLIALVFKRL